MFIRSLSLNVYLDSTEVDVCLSLNVYLDSTEVDVCLSLIIERLPG